MGKSYTPAFRIEVESTADCHMTDAIWHTKRYGRPNTENAKLYVEKFNESLAPDGCNAHIGKAYPNSHMLGIRIIRQETGAVVASYRNEAP